MKMIQKTIYTICLYIGIVGFSSLLFSAFSCGSGECDSPDTDFVFTNVSGYDMEIVVYGFGAEHSFFAKNTAKIEQVGSSFPSLDNILLTDSVKVIFASNDSPKIQTFLSLKNGGKKSSFNILERDNYEEYIDAQGCNHFYNYTFTIDDYNNAE